MNVWESGLEKTVLWDDFDLVISKWAHQNIKISFSFPRNVTTNISKPCPIPGFDLTAPLKFTPKWEEDQEVTVSIIILIGTLENFLKIKLLYMAVKISSKQLHQNIMYLISVDPCES